MSVEILLATHNGERYLPTQLASLAGQTYRGWRLTVRDDASTDSTPALIEGFAQQHAGQVKRLPSASAPGGARDNFAKLIELADADYVLFADQDDVWLPHKVDRLVERIQAVEAQHPGAPVLVHSDLKVVNAQLRELSSSLWRYQGLDPRDGCQFQRLMLENCVTGCACIVNRRLLEVARPIPSAAIMHDWWLALVASTVGVIDSVAEPLLCYRQHASNSVGAKRASVAQLARRTLLGGWAELQASLARKRAQLDAFTERYGDVLQAEHRQLAHDFLSLPRLPIGRRQLLAYRDGLRMSTPVRSVGFYLAM